MVLFNLQGNCQWFGYGGQVNAKVALMEGFFPIIQ